MEKLLCTLVCILYYVTLAVGHPHEEDVHEIMDHETHLYFHLLDDHHYVRHLRPAPSNNTLVVNVDTAITAITRVDERTQEVGLSMILLAIWTDFRLSWNTTSYEGVSSITVPASQIWKPDFSLLNSVYGTMEGSSKDTATLTPDGKVMLRKHFNLRSFCPMDLNNFPLDAHICHVTLFDPSYSAQQLKFQFANHESRLGKFPISRAAGGWEIVGEPVSTIGRALHPDPSDYITVSVHIKRDSSFYQCVVVAPAVLSAALVPFIFILPVHSPAKTAYGVCVLIALILSLRMFTDMVQLNFTALPRIAVFYVSSMSLSAVSIVLSAILHVNSRTMHSPVPAWLRRLCLGRCGLRRWLCMPLYSNVDQTNTFDPMKTDADFTESDVAPLKDGGSDLKEISRHLQLLADRYSSDQMSKDLNSDWLEVARVVDRLLLLIFTALFLITCTSMVG